MAAGRPADSQHRRDLPLLLSLVEVGADTILSYVQAFPDARGFFGRLGPGETSGAPCMDPEPLLAALQAHHAVHDLSLSATSSIKSKTT